MQSKTMKLVQNWWDMYEMKGCQKKEDIKIKNVSLPTSILQNCNGQFLLLQLIYKFLLHPLQRKEIFTYI